MTDTTIKGAKFRDLVMALIATKPGTERNMYYYIKEMIQYLGHQCKDIFIDKPLDGRRDVPDLSVNVRLPSGATRRNWIVIEAKDEKGVFGDASSRQAQFADKSKYLELDTEWFLMVDPLVWVIRRIWRGKECSLGDDVVLPLKSLTREAFLAAHAGLTLDAARACKHLEEFREGKSQIACLRLLPEVPQSKQNTRLFYGALKQSYERLQRGCQRALAELQPEFKRVSTLLDQCDLYGGISTETFTCRKPICPDQLPEMRKVVRELRKTSYRSPNVFRAIVMWKYKLLADYAEKADQYLVAESASLILSRVLMLRFMEDNGFFDEGGRRRYLCNGGVHVFSGFRSYFHKTYPSLLENAYSEGAKLFYSAFVGTDFDWVFDSANADFSDLLEHVLYDLSLFDFSTIHEDILHGVYQKVVDPKLRKQLGQVYTHPQVARLIIDRCLKLAPNGLFLDPSCGTGTFLLEYFEGKWRDPIRRGAVRYSTIERYLADILGNDIDSIATSISRMQLVWRLMSFAKELREKGLPELRISGGEDSLQEFPDPLDGPDFASPENVGRYAIVAGNPPFVRPERQEAGKGESPRTNLYNLFVYQAMTRWLMKGGILGFVLPLSFLDADDSAKIRLGFHPESGGWTIIEIIDMELISKEVFPDASVRPIVMIASNSPAKRTDQVSLSIATPDVVVRSNELLTFDFSKCINKIIPYNDLFTADGRILTHVNTERIAMLRRLSSYPTFEDIAIHYWVRGRGSTSQYSTAMPSDTTDWKEKVMIGRGATFRRKKHHIDGGYRVYKGENISSCLLIDVPVETEVDASKMDEPGPWRCPSILPKIGFALKRISRSLTACPFDPHSSIFLDTATVIFPQDQYSEIPLDFILLSSIYKWFFSSSQREAVIEGQYANVYPRTVRRLPWSDKIVFLGRELKSLKAEYLDACSRLYQSGERLRGMLRSMECETVEDRAIRDGVHFCWESPRNENGWYTYYFEDGTCFAVNDEALYNLLLVILPLMNLSSCDSAVVQGCKVPLDAFAAADLVREKAEGSSTASLRRLGVLQELDRIIGEAFGLSQQDIAWIREDLASDPLFSRLQPDEPYVGKQLRGFWKGLDSAERYR